MLPGLGIDGGSCHEREGGRSGSANERDEDERCIFFIFQVWEMSIPTKPSRRMGEEASTSSRRLPNEAPDGMRESDELERISLSIACVRPPQIYDHAEW